MKPSRPEPVSQLIGIKPIGKQTHYDIVHLEEFSLSLQRSYKEKGYVTQVVKDGKKTKLLAFQLNEYPDGYQLEFSHPCVEFALMGDMDPTAENTRKVAASLSRYPYNLLILLGDLIYRKDITDNITHPAITKPKIEDLLYRTFDPAILKFVAIGNHDYSKSEADEIAFFFAKALSTITQKEAPLADPHSLAYLILQIASQYCWLDRAVADEFKLTHDHLNIPSALAAGPHYYLQFTHNAQPFSHIIILDSTLFVNDPAQRDWLYKMVSQIVSNFERKWLTETLQRMAAGEVLRNFHADLRNIGMKQDQEWLANLVTQIFPEHTFSDWRNQWPNDFIDSIRKLRDEFKGKHGHSPTTTDAPHLPNYIPHPPIFIVSHQPLKTPGKRRIDAKLYRTPPEKMPTDKDDESFLSAYNTELRQTLGHLFQCIDGIFCAHEHFLAHMEIDTGAPLAISGGGGGSKMRHISDPSVTLFAKKTLGHLDIKLSYDPEAHRYQSRWYYRDQDFKKLAEYTYEGHHQLAASSDEPQSATEDEKYNRSTEMTIKTTTFRLFDNYHPFYLVRQQREETRKKMGKGKEQSCVIS